MTVVLLVLKVILFLLLGLAALVLLAAVAVLFVPVSYRLSAENNGAGFVRIEAGWMFGALRCLYRRRGGAGASVIKIMGIPLKNRGGGQNGGGENGIKNGAGGKIKAKASKNESRDVKSGMKSNRRNKAGKNKAAGKGEKAAGSGKKPGIREKLSGAAERIRQIAAVPNKSLFFPLTIRLLKRLARPLKKQRLAAQGVVGFEDPSRTGYVVGMVSAACGILGLNGMLELTGDFEKKVLLYKVSAKGRLYVFSFVWPAAAFILSKPVRSLIRPVIFKKNKLNK